MKNRISRIIICIVIICSACLFVSCKDSKVTTTTTTTDELGLTKISLNVTDIDIYVGDDYKYDNVQVLAYYSDMSIQDVTEEATFSKVSTKTSGEKEITVAYSGFAEKYKINVLNVEPVRVLLDTSNQNTVYYVGEKLSLSSLVVKVYFNNGTTRNIKDYDVEVTDIEYDIVDHTKTFSRTGTFDVKISYGGCNDYFSIEVLSNNYPVSYDFKADYLLNVFEKEEEGTINLREDDYIYKSQFVSIMPRSDLKLHTSKDDSLVYLKFNENEFHSFIEVTNEDSFNVVVAKDVTIGFIYKSNNSKLSLISSTVENCISHTQYKNDVLYEIYKLTAGVYTFSSTQDTLELYGITFNSNDDSGFILYNNIEINLDKVQKEFHSGESFSYDGLIVYGNTTTALDSIVPENYSVQLFNEGIEVNSFTGFGEYTVKVTYNGSIACVDRVKTYTVTYMN